LPSPLSLPPSTRHNSSSIRFLVILIFTLRHPPPEQPRWDLSRLFPTKSSCELRPRPHRRASCARRLCASGQPRDVVKKGKRTVRPCHVSWGDKTQYSPYCVRQYFHGNLDAGRYTRAGRVGVGEKKLAFWQKRSPNCDFLVLRSPSTLSTSKNVWRVGPVWGARWVRFGWGKFSIVFTPYSILGRCTCDTHVFTLPDEDIKIRKQAKLSRMHVPHIFFN
jgi:hypothetical protein